MSGAFFCRPGSLYEEVAVIVVVIIIFALAAGVLAALAVENFAVLTIEVHVKVFGWHAPALPLGVLVLLAFLLGALLLYIVSVIAAWKDRRQLARLRRRLAELEQAHMYMGMQQYPMPTTMPMPGIQPNSPPQWLN
jgi:uncharacterized integral membrane protein